MTNNHLLLADFLADTDIDSLRTLCLETHGVDIRGVYCLQTGRLVGTFDDFVLQFAIDEESADDDETLIDALMSRVVASMRPSPMLNRPDRVTLANLAAKYPVDILCYLINRLHSNRYLATHRDVDILEPYIARIRTHTQWSELAASGVDLKPWIHWLLELDSKRNLHDLTPPTGEFDRLGKWIVTKTGESLFRQITAESLPALLAVFEAWTCERIKEFDQRDKEAKAQEHWIRGNSLTQPAYVRSWIENPEFASKRAELLHKSKNKPLAAIKPKSEKTQKLDAKVSQFLHLLDDIIDGGSEPVTPAKPAPKLMTGAMLFRKKES